MVTAWLVLLMVAAPTPWPVSPRRVVEMARLAVEGDSISAVKGRWELLAPTDRLARLGLASLARLSYDYPAADREYRELISLSPEDAIAVHARLGLAQGDLSRGLFAVADSQFMIVSSDAQRLHDPDAWSAALLGRAVAEARLNGPASALALVDSAAAVEPPRDAPSRAALLCARASALAQTGASVSAQATLGAELARGAGDIRGEGTCLHVLARDQYRAGGNEASIVTLGRAAGLFQRAHDYANAATVRQWRGWLQITMGRPGLARDDLFAAAAAGRASLSWSPVAWAELNLAQTGLLVGDLGSAAGHLASADSLLLVQGDQYGLALVAGLGGALQLMLGDTHGARRAYEEGLHRSAAFYAPATPQFYRALSTVSRREGSLGLASSELDSATVAARALRMNGWIEGLAYDYGAIALRRGEYEVADRLFRAHLRTMGPAQPARIYPTLVRLAQLEALRGEAVRAESLLTEAADVLDRWRDSLTDTQLRTFVFDLRAEDEDPDLGFTDVLAALITSGRSEAAFRLAERRRARELLTRLLRLDEQRPATSQPRPLARLRAVAGAGTDLAAIRPPPGTAIFEYVTASGQGPTVLFALWSAGLRAYVLPAVSTMADDAGDLAQLAEAGLSAGTPARRLGAELLQPAIDDLPDGTAHLIIVADAGLHDLPFIMLSLRDGKMLLDRLATSYGPSVATIVRLESEKPVGGPLRIAAVGDPQRGRLPGSAVEARSVAAFAPGAALRLGPDASEAWLKRAPLDSFRVLHFATHATVSDRSASRSALALAPGDGEDGLVSPAELAALPLRADVVVLSGCRTAGGVPLQGEGIQGLTAPLLAAGARAVVATTWQVDDRADLSLVNSFYGALASGKPLDEALRAAQRDARRHGRPSSEWAAWRVIGDGAVTVPLTTPPSSMFGRPRLALLIALCGGALLFYGWSRKVRRAERTAPAEAVSASTHQW